MWGQVKLAEAGISGTNLAGYDFLDSNLEFFEDVVPEDANLEAPCDGENPHFFCSRFL